MTTHLVNTDLIPVQQGYQTRYRVSEGTLDLRSVPELCTIVCNLHILVPSTVLNTIQHLLIYLLPNLQKDIGALYYHLIVLQELTLDCICINNHVDSTHCNLGKYRFNHTNRLLPFRFPNFFFILFFFCKSGLLRTELRWITADLHSQTHL